MDQKRIVEFDEWIGVLNLATKWRKAHRCFLEIRNRAITELSDLIKQKTVMERIALAREYRVAEWLRDAYLELIQKTPLDLEGLRPAGPPSNRLKRNWEADAKNWEAISRDWETLARIFCLQTKVTASIKSSGGAQYHCDDCGMEYGGYYSDAYLCKCRLLAMVNETFQSELESLGYDGNPLPRTNSPSSALSAALPPVVITGIGFKLKKKKKGKF